MSHVVKRCVDSLQKRPVPGCKSRVYDILPESSRPPHCNTRLIRTASVSVSTAAAGGRPAGPAAAAVGKNTACPLRPPSLPPPPCQVWCAPAGPGGCRTAAQSTYVISRETGIGARSSRRSSWSQSPLPRPSPRRVKQRRVGAAAAAPRRRRPRRVSDDRPNHPFICPARRNDARL